MATQSKLKSNMYSSDDAEGEEGSSAPAAAHVTSPPSVFSTFHEDILLAILSYVADVPFEKVDRGDGQARSPIDSHSTLTHVLPLVSKQFYKTTSNHDLYWKHALLRLVENEPSLWEEGLKRMIFDAKCDELRAEILKRNRNRPVRRRAKRTKHGQLDQQQQPTQPAFVSQIISACSIGADNDNPSNCVSDSSPLTDQEKLLQQACKAMQLHPPRHHTASPSGVHQCVYQSIVLGHMRYQAPVFYMPSSVQLGSQYGLHFFEHRYRLLISEVMASFPTRARRGEQIGPVVQGLLPPNRSQSGILDDDIKHSMLDLFEKNQSLVTNHHYPTFIHAHQAPLRRNSPAAIVRVLQCSVSPDGSADVLLLPLSYIWLEEIWERPGTGGLIEARGIRMGKEASDAYERWRQMASYGMGDGRGRRQMLPIP
mmetsp:Transcript_28252/g.68030  ORF Transcript_28252/g.68030 Transcript_28252/m.68030 type:complete len:425 (+) Transcript_28252:231-1505(+)